MKQKPVSDLLGPHGPEEVDDMLHDVERGETYELVVGDRVIAEVIPPDGGGAQCGG